MRGIPNRKRCQAVLSRGRRQFFKRSFANGGPEAVLSVHIQHGVSSPGSFGFDVYFHQALLNTGGHNGQPLHAMRMDAAEVRFGLNVSLNERFFFIRAQAAEDRDDRVHLLFS
jgi:hypothetical protein